MWKYRLLICDGCGQEVYFSKHLLEDFNRRGAECEECCCTKHADYGIVEFDYPL